MQDACSSKKTFAIQHFGRPLSQKIQRMWNESSRSVPGGEGGVGGRHPLNSGRFLKPIQTVNFEFIYCFCLRNIFLICTIRLLVLSFYSQKYLVRLLAFVEQFLTPPLTGLDQKWSVLMWHKLLNCVLSHYKLSFYNSYKQRGLVQHNVQWYNKLQRNDSFSSETKYSILKRPIAL